jgi:predicted CoA-binding protein
MQSIKDAAAEFLDCRRIAVTGVSRTPQNHGGNVVYRRLKERGYDVFAVNPNADQVEGDLAYPELSAIPGGVEAVVIATQPAHAESTMRQCAALGIKHVWMHRAVGPGSVSESAAEYGRQQGMTVIAGGCPLMFKPASDPGHRVMRVMGAITGKVPRRV